MKKYLLIANYAEADFDNYDLGNNTIVIGDFDTVAEVVEASKADYTSAIEEEADCRFDEDDTDGRNDFLDEQLNLLTVIPAEEDKIEVGKKETIANAYYCGYSRKTDTAYMLIRIF